MGENFCPTLINGLPATNKESERVLLERLNTSSSESDYVETLWKLARYYLGNQSPDNAETTIKTILERTDDPDKQACCYHWLGWFAEERGQYDAAVEHYVKGLALNPTEKSRAYFLNNNTGYCLNLQGKHAEAERGCAAWP